MEKKEVFKLPLFNKNNPFCYLVNNPGDNFRITISFSSIDQNIKIARGKSLEKTIEESNAFYYDNGELRFNLPKKRIDVNTTEFDLVENQFKIIRYILGSTSIMIFIKLIDNNPVNTSVLYVGDHESIEDFIKNSGWF